MEQKELPVFDEKKFIEDTRKVGAYASNEKDELLEVVNKFHRERNQIDEVIEHGQTPFFEAIRSTRTQLKEIWEKDKKETVNALELFNRFASPVFRNESYRYAFFTFEKDLTNKVLEDSESYKDFNYVLPFGLKTVMESVSGYNHEHSFISQFESPRSKIRKSLSEAVSLSIEFSKRDWPFAISWKNLTEIGPVVATTALENANLLRKKTAERFPGSENEMEKILTTAKLILAEYPFGELSDFRVKVLGQLALSQDTNEQRSVVVDEALVFGEMMQNGRLVDRLLKANRDSKLHEFDHTNLIRLYKGWFAYKSLQVSHEEPPEVWGSKIKNFNWEDLIKNKTDLYVLKEINMWVL